MTKAKLQEKYKEWNISIGKEDVEADKAFKKLQDLNAEYGTGKRWCSASLNLKGLIGTKKEDIAFDLYNQIERAEGKMDALRDLALATDNFKI